MIEVDLRSLKRFGNPSYLAFVLAIDFAGAPPDERTIREHSRGTSEIVGRTGNPCYAAQWVLSDRGWTGWLWGRRTLDDAEEWFAVFAQSFRGSSGKIVGGPRDDSRGDADYDPSPALTSTIYLTTSDMRDVDSDVRGWFWGVDETLTRYICDQILYWAHRPRAIERLSYGAEETFKTIGLDHAASMAEMVPAFATFEALLRDPLRLRSGQLGPHGRVSTQVCDPTLDWSTRLDEVRQPLTWSAPQTDYGYIQHAHGGGIVLKDTGHSWPHVDEARVRYNRPLLASFVPDAFGIQLLTDAHLERAHDLTNWDITPLANRRHLVSARDIEPWFKDLNTQGHDPFAPKYSSDGYLPADRDMVDQARNDFGDMILTPEAVERYNPWK